MEVYILEEVEFFIEHLDVKSKARVIRTIELLERFGHQLGLPYSKKILPDLFELRIRGRPALRIFYTYKKGKAIRLYAFVKKSQKIRKKDIDRGMRVLRRLTER